MNYEVRCECGKVHAVSAADAGGMVRCACGRAVDVPPLHLLRAAAGQAALSPAFRLEALLFEGKLPGTRECAGCYRDTDGLIRVAVVCERGTSAPDGSSRDEAAKESFGCLLGLFTSLPGPWSERRAPEYQPSRNRGQDVAFEVPLRVCEVCDHELTTPAALRAALAQFQTMRPSSTSIRTLSSPASGDDAHTNSRIASPALNSGIGRPVASAGAVRGSMPRTWYTVASTSPGDSGRSRGNSAFAVLAPTT